MINPKLFVLSTIFLIGMAACQDDHLNPASGTETTTNTTKVSHTSLVYIVADNSLNSYAQYDIDEILQGYTAIDDTASNHLLVYIDDASLPLLLKVVQKNDTTAVMDTLKIYDEQNSLNPDTMATIINTALELFPADSYGLTLWSHGSGWLPGTDQSPAAQTRSFGVDDYGSDRQDSVAVDSGTQMDIMDLKTALESCPHFKYVLFDACDMQGIEVAYELRNLVDYFISSPGEIPAYGAPYNTVVPAFFSEENTAKAIAKAYYGPYAAAYSYQSSDNSSFSSRNAGVRYVGRFTGGTNKTAQYPYGIAVSVIDASQLDNLAAATKSILTTYLTDNTTVSTDGVLSYDDNYYNFYYDLNSFIESVTDGGSDYTRWKEVFDKALPEFYSTAYIYSSYADGGNGGMCSMADAFGISTFIPADSNFLNAAYWTYSMNLGKAYQTYYREYYQEYTWDTDAGWHDLGW